MKNERARAEGTVVSVNVSRGGVPKRPIPEGVVTELGILGDAVKHTKIHGGPERALCLYSLERIDALRMEGAGIFPGAIGENVTIRGLDWDTVVPGTRLTLGEVEVEVTRYTTPCSTTSPYVNDDVKRFHQDHFPGWSRVYARVLRGGRLAPGMPARVLAPS